MLPLSAATRLLACLLVLSAAGCRGERPEAAFMDFVRAVRSGDRDAAWGFFSAETQRTLEGYLARERPPGAPARPAQEVLFEAGLLTSMREILFVDVLTQSGGRAVLEVVDEQEQKQQVSMVLEEGRWRVEIEIPAAGPVP